MDNDVDPTDNNGQYYNFLFALGTSFPKALVINKQIVINYVRLGWSTNCLQLLPNELLKLTALKR